MSSQPVSKGRRDVSPVIKIQVNEKPNPGICCLDETGAELHRTKSQVKNLKPLKDLRMIDGKDVEVPQNFPDAPLLTTIVQKGKEPVFRSIWSLIGSANFAIPGLMLVSTENQVIEEANKKLEYYRTAVSMHPSFYRKMKLSFPSLVGGVISRRTLTEEEAKGNLGRVYETLTREEFGL